MNNHFIIPYTGNKRTEVKEIYEALDLKNITTISEPFCGSSAISYYISTLHPNKYTYILNDIDKNLIRLYNIIKDDIKYKYLCVLYELQLKAINDKTTYLKIINENGIISYLIKHKYYRMRTGLYPNDGQRKKLLNNNYPIINFLRNENVIIYNGDAIEIIKKYNNKKTLHILDPPYLFTNNSQYNQGELQKKDFNIYEHLVYNKYKTNIYYVVENIWIIDLIYKKKVIKKYRKKYYGIRKKEVDHVIIKL